jgi:hypothetical protein
MRYMITWNDCVSKSRANVTVNVTLMKIEVGA